MKSLPIGPHLVQVGAQDHAYFARAVDVVAETAVLVTISDLVPGDEEAPTPAPIATSNTEQISTLRNHRRRSRSIGVLGSGVGGVLAASAAILVVTASSQLRTAQSDYDDLPSASLEEQQAKQVAFQSLERQKGSRNTAFSIGGLMLGGGMVGGVVAGVSFGKAKRWTDELAAEDGT